MTDAIVDPRLLEVAVEKSIENKIKIYPRHSIWASQLDHPCLRQNEYALTRWQDAIKISGRLQEIFDEGHIHEEAVLEKLKTAGFKVRQSQRPLFEKVKHNGKEYRYGISGRLDTELTHDLLGGVWYPAEIKSMEPFAWESINTVGDLLKHKRYYLRMYPGQVMLYLYASGVERGLMILKNKVSGRLKFIWINLNLDYVEGMLKKAEEINEVVAKIEASPDKADDLLTERISFDEKICGSCAFAHICLPDRQFGGEEIVLDEATELSLERREVLKSYADEFKELDESLKEKFKARGAGKYLVGSSFDVAVTSVQTTLDGTPKEIKEQYKKPSSYLKVSIKCVKK